MDQVLTYRYRLLPTKRQRLVLEQILEDQRILYNAALEERIAVYEKTGKARTRVEQYRALTECRHSLPDMAALPVKLQRATLNRLDEAFSAFYRRVRAGEKPGFPRFKGRGWFTSFGFCEFQGISFDGKRLRFKGLPSGLRVHLHRSMPTARILSCQFKRDTKGWMVSFQIRVECPEKRPITKSVGVDLGIKTLAALSDGTRIPNPKAARKAQKNLQIRQRALQRSVPGSRRRRKTKLSLSSAHQKVANRRRTMLHQITAMLVTRFDLIAVEKLNIKGLSRMHYSADVLDASWRTLIDLLRYKAERAGAHLVEVNANKTSQECPDCGAIEPKTLSQRTHKCGCGCEVDRDIAAARVILSRAVALPGVGNVTR